MHLGRLLPPFPGDVAGKISGTPMAMGDVRRVHMIDRHAACSWKWPQPLPLRDCQICRDGKHHAPAWATASPDLPGDRAAVRPGDEGHALARRAATWTGPSYRDARLPRTRLARNTASAWSTRPPARWGRGCPWLAVKTAPSGTPRLLRMPSGTQTVQTPPTLGGSCRHCRHWVIILPICTVFKRCRDTVLDRKAQCGQAVGACAGAGGAEAHRGRGGGLLLSETPESARHGRGTRGPSLWRQDRHRGRCLCVA